MIDSCTGGYKKCYRRDIEKNNIRERERERSWERESKKKNLYFTRFLLMVFVLAHEGFKLSLEEEIVWLKSIQISL